MELSSITHPNPDLYYNDTFKEFKVTWKKPYTSAKGYWYTLNKSASLQLTPTNGTYTAATNLTLPASKFASSGIWYFYILSVHSNAQASKLSNRWTVRINSKPHTLTSSSHPDSKLWVSDPTKKTLAVSWKAPSGVPSNSFRGFWYKLDRTSNTAPGRAAEGWTYTTNKQALLTKDWQNKPLDRWTYYFHLVSEDAAGNLTKAAAHYRIQLGTQPSKLNYFGYVKDASGQPIKDISIELQPYGHKATTDANGYFIFKDIYTGTYTLTATKQGLKNVRVQVNVNASASPYNFKMTP